MFVFFSGFRRGIHCEEISQPLKCNEQLFINSRLRIITTIHSIIDDKENVIINVHYFNNEPDDTYDYCKYYKARLEDLIANGVLVNYVKTPPKVNRPQTVRESFTDKRNLHYRNRVFINCLFNNLVSTTFSNCAFIGCEFGWHAHTHYYKCVFVDCDKHINDTTAIKELATAY